MDQEAVFQVVAQSLGADIVFNIPAKANHVLDGIAVVDADDLLLDDGPGIQLFGDIVAGRVNELHPSLRSPLIGSGTDERGQKTVMNIYHTMSVRLAKQRRKNLHVADDSGSWRRGWDSAEFSAVLGSNLPHFLL